MSTSKTQYNSPWSRFVDYIIGRNALIGLASLMLLCLSGFATWSGMSDFILGVQTNTATQGREIGGLSVTNEMLVIGIVIALTFLMWLALRETFGAQRRWSERAVTFPLYVFLFLWSIGFGYGFWWSLIAGEEATRTSLSGLREDARDAASTVAARLDAVSIQLDSVVSWSDGQMQREEKSGGSCGIASGAGRGPLYNSRQNVRDSVSSLRDSINVSWLGAVRKDLDDLRQTAASLEGNTVAERQKNFEASASGVRGKAKSIAARSNQLGRSTANEMRALAEAVSQAPGTSGFSCFDPTLAQRLRQAADQASEPAELKLRNASFNEGPAGVANAVKNLWLNMGSSLSQAFRYVVTLGNPGKIENDQSEPMSGRDLIALLATLGVDLGLFAMALLNPPGAPPIRRDGLSSTQARLRLPSGAVIRQITSAFETAISRAPGADLEWVRKHLFHHNGRSYFVIPNIFSVSHDEEFELRALAINQLVGVLDDLGLVTVVSERELKKAQKEERRESWTSIYVNKKENELTEQPQLSSSGNAAGNRHKFKMMNHGLLSKASRVLDIAGWGQGGQQDFELFTLIDAEGLTPLLVLLNEATLAKGAEMAEVARKEHVEIQQEKIMQLEDKRPTNINKKSKIS